MLQVAALAGLPRPVVERATDLLAFFGTPSRGGKGWRIRHSDRKSEHGQSSLMGYFAAAAMNQTKTQEAAPLMPQAHHDIIERIEGLDIDEMTPRQAHDALYQLKKLLGGDAIE